MTQEDAEIELIISREVKELQNIEKQIGSQNLNQIKISVNKLKAELEGAIEWPDDDEEYKKNIIKTAMERIVRSAIKKIRSDKKNDRKFIKELMQNVINNIK